MIANDASLVIIGVEHIATKNSLTVRARIFLRDVSGVVYSFDADTVTWEMDKLQLQPVYPRDEPMGVVNAGIAR